MSLSLTRLATARLLSAGPETCKRLEAQVLVAQVEVRLRPEAAGIRIG